MNTWLENKWDALRTNFWFLPGVMAVLAVAGPNDDRGAENGRED